MDSALDQDKSEFSISILSVLLHMLPHIDCLFDQVVQIFRDLGSETVLFQNSQNFISSDTFDLGDTIVISEHNTNLGGGAALLGELHNLFNQVIS